MHLTRGSRKRGREEGIEIEAEEWFPTCKSRSKGSSLSESAQLGSMSPSNSGQAQNSSRPSTRQSRSRSVTPAAAPAPTAAPPVIKQRAGHGIAALRISSRLPSLLHSPAPHPRSCRLALAPELTLSQQDAVQPLGSQRPATSESGSDVLMGLPQQIGEHGHGDVVLRHDDDMLDYSSPKVTVTPLPFPPSTAPAPASGPAWDLLGSLEEPAEEEMKPLFSKQGAAGHELEFQALADSAPPAGMDERAWRDMVETFRGSQAEAELQQCQQLAHLYSNLPGCDHGAWGGNQRVTANVKLPEETEGPVATHGQGSRDEENAETEREAVSRSRATRGQRKSTRAKRDGHCVSPANALGVKKEATKRTGRREVRKAAAAEAAPVVPVPSARAAKKSRGAAAAKKEAPGKRGKGAGAVGGKGRRKGGKKGKAVAPPPETVEEESEEEEGGLEQPELRDKEQEESMANSWWVSRIRDLIDFCKSTDGYQDAFDFDLLFRLVTRVHRANVGLPKEKRDQIDYDVNSLTLDPDPRRDIEEFKKTGDYRPGLMHRVTQRDVCLNYYRSIRRQIKPNITQKQMAVGEKRFMGNIKPKIQENVARLVGRLQSAREHQRQRRAAAKNEANGNA